MFHVNHGGRGCHPKFECQSGIFYVRLLSEIFRFHVVEARQSGGVMADRLPPCKYLIRHSLQLTGLCVQ